jgi:uncharacterized membrane protein
MQADDSSGPIGTETPAATEKRRIRRSTGLNKAFRAIKAQHSANRTSAEILADRMIGLASSTAFLVIHAILFVVWIVWNIPGVPLPQFDPYPYGMLTTIVSLEAIFLSIFVLMAQQRESAIAELREELGLQVNLRVEQEVTKTLQLVAGLYTRLGHRVSDDPELHHMLQPLDVRAIERDLLEQIEAATSNRHHNTMLDDGNAHPSLEPRNPVLR